MTHIQLTLDYPTSCLSCGEFMARGTKACWKKDVGAWHPDCPVPQSVLKEDGLKAKRQALGLEAPEFGSAPMLRERRTGDGQD